MELAPERWPVIATVQLSYPGNEAWAYLFFRAKLESFVERCSWACELADCRAALGVGGDISIGLTLFFAGMDIKDGEVSSAFTGCLDDDRFGTAIARGPNAALACNRFEIGDLASGQSSFDGFWLFVAVIDGVDDRRCLLVGHFLCGLSGLGKADQRSGTECGALV